MKDENFEIRIIEAAKVLVHEYIHYYNHIRIQGVLNYRTPLHYAEAC